jgi:hypothetical protein
MYQKMSHESINEEEKPLRESLDTGNSVLSHLSKTSGPRRRNRLADFCLYTAIISAWALSLVVMYLSAHKPEQYSFSQGYETDLGQSLNDPS